MTTIIIVGDSTETWMCRNFDYDPPLPFGLSNSNTHQIISLPLSPPSRVGIAWALYNLARHPDHQEKCRQEVDAVFNERDEMDW